MIRKSIRVILILVFLGILIYSFRNLFNFSNDIRKTQQVIQQVQEIAIIEEYEEVAIDFNALQSVNNDTVGWIKFYNYINFPIMQSNDNSFYLYRDFNREWNSLGSIFLDYRNDGFNGRNSILYGHSTVRGNMDAFGSLELLHESSFFDEEKLIEIFTEESTTQWQIFSVYTIHSEDSRYLTTGFTNDEQFDEWLTLISGRSIHEFENKPNIESQILTLSTCHGASGTPYRLVVHAMLVE